jgi:hypothetical protein
MSGSASWEIGEPTTLDLDGPVHELHLRLVDGALNVFRAPDPQAPVRVEISELAGGPLRIKRREGTVHVGYADLTWDAFLMNEGRGGFRRRAVVSVSAPEHVRLTAGLVGASAVVSKIAGGTTIRSVSGPVTLAGLDGPVDVRTATGDVEGQSLRGSLRFHSASGDLTLLDGAPEVHADSASGRLMLDLAPGTTAPVLSLNSVSGAVAVRFPPESGAGVRATSISGSVSSEFDALAARGGFGPRRLGGTLGNGRGRVKISTVSGSIALLRRPTDHPTDAPTASPLAKDI